LNIIGLHKDLISLLLSLSTTIKSIQKAVQLFVLLQRIYFRNTNYIKFMINVHNKQVVV
jgi:hypothetical protein